MSTRTLQTSCSCPDCLCAAVKLVLVYTSIKDFVICANKPTLITFRAICNFECLRSALRIDCCQELKVNITSQQLETKLASSVDGKYSTESLTWVPLYR